MELPILEKIMSLCEIVAVYELSEVPHSGIKSNKYPLLDMVDLSEVVVPFLPQVA